jgi:hypothetical protein
VCVCKRLRISTGASQHPGVDVFVFDVGKRRHPVACFVRHELRTRDTYAIDEPRRANKLSSITALGKMDETTTLSAGPADFPRFRASKNFVEPGLLHHQCDLRGASQATALARLPLRLPANLVSKGCTSCITLRLPANLVSRGCASCITLRLPANLVSRGCASRITLGCSTARVTGGAPTHLVHKRSAARSAQTATAIAHEEGY